MRLIQHSTAHPGHSFADTLSSSLFVECGTALAQQQLHATCKLCATVVHLVDDSEEDAAMDNNTDDDDDDDENAATARAFLKNGARGWW